MVAPSSTFLIGPTPLLVKSIVSEGLVVDSAGAVSVDTSVAGFWPILKEPSSFFSSFPPQPIKVMIAIAAIDLIKCFIVVRLIYGTNLRSTILTQNDFRHISDKNIPLAPIFTII